jgi:DNA-binding winged helix-turn-helix (wHTH) protein/tetratricopeptide (TPR) repeat protein/ABC-type cobalamin/Fe3+-siderophores transport system ATPase subunit
MRHPAFRFADWEVDPSTNSLSRDGERRQMEPRAMDVLVTLCRQPNTIISSEELLEKCWGTTLHGDNPIHKTIAQLRNLLGDNTKSPLYIETIRKRGYRTIGEVLSLDAPKLDEDWRGKSPFRGLQSFSENDATVFFGRSEATTQLLHTVAAQAGAGRMTLVLGPSGSGKTSLVRAGLIPALLKRGHSGLRGVSATSFDLAELGDHPLQTALGGVLLDWQVGDADVFAGESSVSLGERLLPDFDGVLDALRAALGTQPAHEGARFVLFIDRLETLFTAPQVTPTQRQRFLAVLAGLARSRYVIVVAACRNDFYPHVANDTVLMASKPHGGHFDVAPPSQAEIAQIIRLPAQTAGLRFGFDGQSRGRLDDVLCASAATPDSLPLLQHILQELYRLRTPEGELSFDAFDRLGGVEGAIGRRAEEVVGALTEVQGASLPRLLSMLVTLSDRDDAVTSRRVPWSALRTPAEQELVTALVEARLFVSDLVGNAPGFGVAHEAVLRHWPRVTAWIDQHRNALRVRGRLQSQASRWVNEGRSSDLLLPAGKQLDEAAQLLGDQGLSLSTDEIAIIKASSRKARRRARLRVGTLCAIVGLSLLVAGFGLFALRANKVAQARRAEAEGLMGYMLGDFAEKLRPLGRLDLLDSVSGKALEYLSGSDSEDLTVTALTQRAKALQVLAEVRIARGQPDAALEALGAAQTLLLRQQATGQNQWEVVKNLGANAFWQGQIYLNQSNWDKAQQAFDQYRQYSDRLYQIDPANVDGWIEQSYAHTNLGQLALKRGDPKAAADQLAASIALKEKARQKKPQDRTLAADLANSLSWLGTTKEAQGHLTEAMGLYERELAIVEQLHKAAPDAALWSYKTGISLQRRARLRMYLGQDSAALADLEQAETLMRVAVGREPNHRAWQGGLSTVRLDRAHIMLHGPHDVAKALALLLALRSETKALTELDPKSADWVRLAELTNQTIGIAFTRLGRFADARDLLDKSTQRLEGLYAANRADKRVATDLAQGLLLQADLLEPTGKRDAVLANCGKAAELIPAATQSHDPRVLNWWTRSQLCLGNRATAKAAMAQLSRMGYQEASYLDYIHNHNLKENE